MKSYKNISIIQSKNIGKLTKYATNIFRRIIQERSNVTFLPKRDDSLIIKLSIVGKLKPESFKITYCPESGVEIIGGDGNGLLYGIGKFLHSSTFTDHEIIPSVWVGISEPDKKIRGMYFATHFHNFYHDAPIKVVSNYIEELALWGINSLSVWFDMHHFESIDDPEAEVMLDRLSQLLRIGKQLGMETGIMCLANEGYRNTPEKIKATATGKSHYGVEICPSTSAAVRLILKQIDDEVNRFQKKGVVLDRITIWPYDQGGCECKDCTPWGANGFIKISKQLSHLIREKLPNTEIILSTWLFDYFKDAGEWKNLHSCLKEDSSWIDALLVDSHTEFPTYPLNNKLSTILPIVSFPEISMWKMWPWGGIGANPLVTQLGDKFTRSNHIISGTFPYSEGIYEDINKIVYSQLCWDSSQSIEQILKEYIIAEYGNQAVENIYKAIQILEKNHHHCLYMHMFCENMEFKKWDTPDDAGACEAFELLERANDKMPEWAKSSWRWRILFIRAYIDKERFSNAGLLTYKCEPFLIELTDIYYAQNANIRISPPSKAAIARHQEANAWGKISEEK